MCAGLPSALPQRGEGHDNGDASFFSQRPAFIGTPLAAIRKMYYLCTTRKGEVLEWLKRRAWKARIRLKRIRGSNPLLSAKRRRIDDPPSLFFARPGTRNSVCDRTAAGGKRPTFGRQPACDRRTIGRQPAAERNRGTLGATDNRQPANKQPARRARPGNAIAGRCRSSGCRPWRRTSTPRRSSTAAGSL